MKFLSDKFFLLSGTEEFSISAIRKQLLSWMLILLAVLALPTILIGAIEAIHIGIPYTAFLYACFSIPLIIALLFQKKLPYIIIVLLFLFTAYSLAVYNLIDYGFSGAAIPIFCTIAVLSTVFLGVKAGLLSLLFNTIPMVIVAILMSREQLSIEIDLMEISSNPVSWLTAIIVMLFLGSIMIFGYGVVQINLINSQRLIHNKTRDLQQTNQKLENDIAERMKVERQLEIALEKAEESDRLKSAFLANMSHEIRTPMNGILGFSELLKEPELDGDQKKQYIDIIEKSGIRMLEIINDIVEISKIESKQIQTKISDTNVYNGLKYIHDFFKLEAENRGLKLLLQNESLDQNFTIKTDQEKLIGILTNFTKNALKYTKVGTVILKVEVKDKLLVFHVTDTGVGISEEQLLCVFDRFRQGEEVLTKEHEGAGLGLAISKAYAEILGGEIGVTSILNKGSDFYLKLPC